MDMVRATDDHELGVCRVEVCRARVQQDVGTGAGHRWPMLECWYGEEWVELGQQEQIRSGQRPGLRTVGGYSLVA
jgi:hypothetical protein